MSLRPPPVSACRNYLRDQRQKEEFPSRGLVEVCLFPDGMVDTSQTRQESIRVDVAASQSSTDRGRGPLKVAIKDKLC